MKTIATTVMCACMALAAGSAVAMGNDDMKMTMQECKDHMAMSKKAGATKDDAMMKKDAMCADMMKKEGMSGDTMKKEGMSGDTMKKEGMSGETHKSGDAPKK